MAAVAKAKTDGARTWRIKSYPQLGKLEDDM